MIASTAWPVIGATRLPAETISPGNKNEMICRRPSGKATDDIAQPLQMIGTKSDHSFGCKIRRRAGMVWTVAERDRLSGEPAASPSFIKPPHSRLNAGQSMQGDVACHRARRSRSRQHVGLSQSGDKSDDARDTLSRRPSARRHPAASDHFSLQYLSRRSHPVVKSTGDDCTVVTYAPLYL